MRDLVILTADSTMTHVLRAFFKRDRFEQSLGCGKIDLDPETEIFHVPGFTDGGLHTHAHQLLRPYLSTHRYAMVLLDRQFGGEQPAEIVQQDIQLNLRRNGWNDDRHEAVVIVIDPELEVWLWQDSPHVERAIRAPIGLRERLRGEGAWPENHQKPLNPKETLRRQIAANHAGTTFSAYSLIAATVSPRRCQDPSFQCFRDQLRAWFPVQGENHAA